LLSARIHRPRSWPHGLHWLAGLLALLAALSLAPPLAAQPAVQTAAPPALPASAGEVQAGVPLLLNQRHIVDFRGTMLGQSPAERAAQARVLLRQVLAHDGPGLVTLWLQDSTVGLQVDGRIVFYLQPADVALDHPGEPLPATAEVVRARLQAALAEVREAGDLRRIGQGLAVSLLATGLAWGALHLVWRLPRRLSERAAARLARWEQASANRGLARTYAHHALGVAHGSLHALTWLLVLLLADLWFTFVLGQFAYTRPWAERSTQWLLGLLQQFALAVAGAVPGLLSAALIFFIAWQVAQALANLLRRVERGTVQLTWLDRDTAGPTRRVGTFVIWLFALAFAYPFLPGASSDAFKGVTVLAGLMLSLGGSSVVGQIISGLSLMYARTMRSGEYVKIGETEGTVSSVGMFSTKVLTGLGEEVSLPNAWVFGQPVRNFSRLAPEGRFVLHTAVTIGYATPWRQVHAMLLEAARRAPDVADEPAPYVVQDALSDFYVEYRLCAHSSHSAPRRRAEAMSQLHGCIQDVFNENGVQIMSPHYLADPPLAQVVPPGGWAPDLAPPAPVPPTPPQAGGGASAR
jgi:small-conductance mechanosensitive channel